MDLNNFETSCDYYFYILPFKDKEMFKVGITSGKEFNRLIGLNRKVRIDAKESILFKAHKEVVKSLEKEIKAKFSKYNMSKEAVERYSLFGGHTEVFNIDCLDQVIRIGTAKKHDTNLEISIEKGLSIAGLYTDNNIDNSESSGIGIDHNDSSLNELITDLIKSLNSGEVSRVNYGFKKKTNSFSVFYLIEAENEFKISLLNKSCRFLDDFQFGKLIVRHELKSGQKLCSGSTYLKGEINLQELKKDILSNEFLENIKRLNTLLELMVDHPKRDKNFQAVSYSNGRFTIASLFYSYEIGQEVSIGKSLTFGDSCLW